MKSSSIETHLKDLRKALEVFRKYKMKLNPVKCTFAIEAGKFLGFKISQKGIKANPEKVKALQDMECRPSKKTFRS